LASCPRKSLWNFWDDQTTKTKGWRPELNLLS
jgi:hypothetical protein